MDPAADPRSEEHTSELQSHSDLVCRLLLEKKKKKIHREIRNLVHHNYTPPALTSVRVQLSPQPLTPALDQRSRSDRPESLLFFNQTAPTETYTLSLHDALPI